MNKKLGWYELNKPGEFGEGLTIGVFSIDWRKNEDKPDCYYPDIILSLSQTRTDGHWYISEMNITNPEGEEFSDLAIQVLKGIKGKLFKTINEITANLGTFLEDRIPEDIAW